MSFAVVVPLAIAAGAVGAVSSFFDRSTICSSNDLLIDIEHQSWWGFGPGNLSRTGVGEAQPANYWLGVAAAAGVVLFVIIFGLTVVQWFTVGRRDST